MIIWTALFTFGIGMLILIFRMNLCRKYKIQYPRFMIIYSVIGFIGFFTSLLNLLGAEEEYRHWLYAVIGIIYLISVLWTQERS